MNNKDVIIDLHPTAAEVNFIEDKLNEFNIKKTGLPFGGYISCVIRDDKNLIIAGAHGYVWGDCCHIEYMWVDELQRGNGYGNKLLHIIEEEAAKKGCKMIVAETFSFQALPFYEKASYEIAGKVDGFPTAPYQHYFLKKNLH
jgi:GNAT superfamily N-acetyltransferase